MEALITTEILRSHMLTVPWRKVFIITLVRKVASHSICAFEMFYMLFVDFLLITSSALGFWIKSWLPLCPGPLFSLCYSKQSEFGSGGWGEVGEVGGVEGWETMLGIQYMTEESIFNKKWKSLILHRSIIFTTFPEKSLTVFSWFYKLDVILWLTRFVMFS